MDISYDIWTGESIEEIIQTIAEFRIQLFPDNAGVTPILSEELARLHHYFDDETFIVVANDCSKFVGYIALVGISDHHPALMAYSHFGSDIKVSEGPMVHPYYRKMELGNH